MRGTRAALLSAAWLWLGILACSDLQPAGGAGQGERLPNAPAAGEAPVDRPHVVFNSRSLVIARLGVPVAPPVSVPSRPSPETIQSEDPTVVRVDPSGTVIGLRAGRTRVRTLHGEGSSLEVEVRAPRAIRLEPARLELEPERAAVFTLLDAESGERLPPEGAEWSSDAPRRASVLEGRVQAGSEPGPASVLVRFGEATAQAVVLVGVAAAGSGQALSVNPPRARLRTGEVRAFLAYLPSGPVGAEWESGNPRVVAALRDGLFAARTAGRTSICAAAQGRRACANVEVTQ